MFHIHQTTSVTDYVEHFSTLFDQLKAYEPNPDLHYYTTHFVDGLRADIRAIVTMQWPSYWGYDPEVSQGTD
jgi:thiaminase